MREKEREIGARAKERGREREREVAGRERKRGRGIDMG